jgi:AcrR family transcriptional regulator
MSSQKPSAAADVGNRTRLLQAATDAFAEQGFEGASLRVIADSAGVSFQLITYYFGSKEALWIATVEYLFERYFETGKGLGFTTSGNIYEQFHNHLRLLLTDMQQRPQLRKIWIQEYFANSERYHNVIKPQIKRLHDDLAMPYYKEVVRLGIVKSFTEQELAILFTSLIQNNVVYPHFLELVLGLPAGSAKSVETQIDLIFRVLTADARASSEPSGDETPFQDRPPESDGAERGPGTVVYAWKDGREPGARTEQSRLKQLEVENLHLKQLVGSLSLEKKVLLEMLERRAAPDKDD